MLDELTRNWWVVLLRGIVSILFGIVAFLWPGVTLLAIVFMYGAFALADGIAALTLGLSGRKEGESWWPMLLVGIAGIVAGLFAFIWPGITAFVLLALVASWSIVRGIFEIAAAVYRCAA
jgi:uncharacterized membrane protein HdeD (DUF308 family)